MKASFVLWSHSLLVRMVNSSSLIRCERFYGVM